MVASRSSAVVAPDGTASRVLSVCSGITRQRAVSAVRVGGDGSLGEGCGGLGPWKSALKPRCMPRCGHARLDVDPCQSHHLFTPGAERSAECICSSHMLTAVYDTTCYNPTYGCTYRQTHTKPEAKMIRNPSREYVDMDMDIRVSTY